MRHELSLEGFRFALRPVETADAAFIVALRTDPDLGRFLHATSPDVARQAAWIEAYQDRPGDWYFVIQDLQHGGEPVGTIGVYDSDGRQAEWGRWLVRKGSLAAVESAVLIYRMAFERLGLEEVYCRTVADNTRVVSFHDSSGARRAAVLPGFFELNGVRHDAVEHRVDRPLWAAMRARLEPLAQRLAEP